MKFIQWFVTLTDTTKYFGCELGAQTQFDIKNDRYIVNGSHDAAKLQDLLDGFIKRFVLCPECDNPETNLVWTLNFFFSLALNRPVVILICICCRSKILDLSWLNVWIFFHWLSFININSVTECECQKADDSSALYCLWLPREYRHAP